MRDCEPQRPHAIDSIAPTLQVPSPAHALQLPHAQSAPHVWARVPHRPQVSDATAPGSHSPVQSQRPARHVSPLAQSPGVVHGVPLPQPGQSGPPQSTPVSPGPITPSLQPFVQEYVVPPSPATQ